MSCAIHNKSGKDMSALTGMVKQFYPYAQKYLGFDKPAEIVYQSDPANAQDPLGKTAHYQPDNYTVTLYVDGRHPKDLLRSLAHELVHHTQNCRGDLCADKMGETGEGYAQTNKHLRKMEQEAYASMVMRDWEDQYKSKRRNNLNETNYTNKEYYTMSEHEKLIQRIVAEVMKNAEVTTESEEEDEDVQEEGQGDRFDKDREQGRASTDRRQGASSGGAPGQNLEENDEKGIWTPNHYCIHHGGVQMNGSIQMAEAVGHNYDDELGRVTHYNMKLADGTILENVAAEDIQVTNASLAEGHGKHKRDDNKKPDADGDGVPDWADKKKGDDNEDDDKDKVEEAAQGSRQGGDRAKQQCEKQGKKLVAGKCVPLDESNEEDGATIEESEEDTSDDLQETFRRRQEKLFERLTKWSKQ